MSPLQYAFRFYGAAPGEWEDGARDGMTYELHFRTAPDELARADIASAFEKSVAGSVVSPRTMEPWRWAGAWAAFAVGIEWDADAPPDGASELVHANFFETMRSLFLAIHAVAPLEEVLFLNAVKVATDQHNWDAWTVSQRAVPDAGPAWRGAGLRLGELFTSRASRPAIDDAIDASFEAQRLAVRNQLAKSEPWWRQYFGYIDDDDEDGDESADGGG